MPISRIGYVDQPYAGKRHTPDTSRLTALYTRMGEALAETALRKGEITERGLQTLGQLFSRYQGTQREEKAAIAAETRRQRERQEDRDFTAEQQRLEREARQAERDETARVRADERAYRRGADVAAEVGSGPMSEMQLEDVMGGPAAGRARYEFGPGTAEGPTLDPTREQRDVDIIRQQIERFGGTVGPNGQIVMPPKPEREPNPTEATLALRAAQGDKAAAQALRLMRPPTAPTAADKPSVWLTKAGKDAFVTPADAARMVQEGWKKPAGENKPASGLEKRALNFFNRAEQADKDLENLEPWVTSLSPAGQARLSYAHNALQTPEGRQYTAAQRAFTEARLRKDSGAAIPPHEFESDRQTYFPQFGDDPKTLEQKRRARGAILSSLGFESGQALGEFLGDADEARRVVQQYRERAEGKLKPTVGQVPKDGAILIDGFTVRIKPGGG